MVCADLEIYESRRRDRSAFTSFDEMMMPVQKYCRLIERELRGAIFLDELQV